MKKREIIKGLQFAIEQGSQFKEESLSDKLDILQKKAFMILYSTHQSNAKSVTVFRIPATFRISLNFVVTISS